MTLDNGEYQIHLVSVAQFTPGSADNACSFDRTYTFSESETLPTCAHGIHVVSSGAAVGSAVLVGYAGATGIHAHSAVLRDHLLFVAISDHIACLKIPRLDLLWSRVVDPCTCFGIHPITGSIDFICHGELEIARIAADGALLWSQGGSDIFTGDLSVHADEVRVSDFENRSYAFDLISGTSRR